MPASVGSTVGLLLGTKCSSLTLLDASETGGRLVLSDFGLPHRAHCLSVLGWARKSVELAGATVTYAEEERCRTLGHKDCELVLRWT